MEKLKSYYQYEEYFGKLHLYFENKEYVTKFKYWGFTNKDQNFFKNLEKLHFTFTPFNNFFEKLRSPNKNKENLEKEIQKIKHYINCCTSGEVHDMVPYLIIDKPSPVILKDLKEFKEIEKYLTEKINKLVYDIMNQDDFSLKFFVKELEKLINDTRNFIKKLNPKNKGNKKWIK